MQRDGIEDFARRQQAVGGRLQMTARRFRIGLTQGCHGRRHVLPELRGGQQVLVRHRLEQRLDVQMTEADAEKRCLALRPQVEQRQRRRGVIAPSAQRLAQIGQGGLAFLGGTKRQGAGGANALVPVVGQHQRRIVRHAVKVSGRGLLVVVRRAEARRAGSADQRGGVPQRRVAVEEGGHFLVAEIESVLRRRPVRTQKD